MTSGALLEQETTSHIIGAFFDVYNTLGTEVLAPTAQRQLLNYLRATSFQVGLLLHFGPKPRFSRLVHSHKPRPR